MNNIEYHWTIFTNFGNFLIKKEIHRFDWKSNTRHSFLEFVAKSGQNFIKNSQKKCKIWREMWKKNRNSIFNREKMLAIFGWNFEFGERCKGASPGQFSRGWTRFFSLNGFPRFWDSIPKRCKGNPCILFVLHLHSRASHMELNWKSPFSTLFLIRRHSSSFARKYWVASCGCLWASPGNFFPWLSGPGSFLPTVLVFGIQFQSGAKECIV